MIFDWVFTSKIPLQKSGHRFTDERIEAERLAKKAKEYERYVAAVAEVEKKYAEEQKELDKKTKKRIEKMVKEHGDNPEEMTKKLAEEFGLKLGSVNE